MDKNPSIVNAHGLYHNCVLAPSLVCYRDMKVGEILFLPAIHHRKNAAWIELA